MDPITATIIGGLLWFFLGSLGATLVYLAVAFFVGGGLAALTGHEGFVVLGVFLGWVIACLWEIFVLFQVIIHVVRLIQLATGSAVTV